MHDITWQFVKAIGTAHQAGDIDNLARVAMEAIVELDRALEESRTLARFRERDTEYRRERVRRSGGEVTPSLRYAILARDQFRCRACGASAPSGAVLHVDHVIPVAAGGPTTEDNLQTLCAECNGGKSDTTSEDAV